MGKIVYVSLHDGETRTETVAVKKTCDAGRSLIVDILSKSEGKNNVVLAPGLLTGTMAPCTGRLNMGAKRVHGRGYSLANTAGPFAQKLASLDIAALVIEGDGAIPRTVVVSNKGIEVRDASIVSGCTAGQTVEQLRNLYGADAAILGVGPAGEQLLPLAGVFSTYPAPGKPGYHVSRNKMGSAFGKVGLKAVVVNNSQHFFAEVNDAESFSACSKQLAKSIVSHPVCGKAMPAYGSITLLHMLKFGRGFSQALADSQEQPRVRTLSPGLNRNCAPGCVIGCLNRHAASDDEVYTSPSESEVMAACTAVLGQSDHALARNINNSCFELGLDSVEFIHSADLFLKLQGQAVTGAAIHSLLGEFAPLTLTGRIIGQCTSGLAALYADTVEQHPLPKKPEDYRSALGMPVKAEGCEGLTDLEYLHGYMLGIENLGICLFTAFAIMDDPQGIELLAQLVSAKTGVPTRAKDIIEGGLDTQMRTLKLDQDEIARGNAPQVPEFIKVLYKYFALREH